MTQKLVLFIGLEPKGHSSRKELRAEPSSLRGIHLPEVSGTEVKREATADTFMNDLCKVSSLSCPFSCFCHIICGDKVSLLSNVSRSQDEELISQSLLRTLVLMGVYMKLRGSHRSSGERTAAPSS